MSYNLDTSTPPHTILRGSTYYLNLRVPKAQQQLHGQIIRSKLSSDKDQANMLAEHVVRILKTLIVVILDECSDLTLKVAGQIVVFEQNPVLHGLMPALDFALGLRVQWRTADMRHFLILQPLG